MCVSCKICLKKRYIYSASTAITILHFIGRDSRKEYIRHHNLSFFILQNENDASMLRVIKTSSVFCFMPLSIPEAVLVGIAWHQCNSYKSCSSFAPILFFLGLCYPVTVIAKSYRRSQRRSKKRNQRSKCKLEH